nr:hypothetical protein [Tanacetum cinerariifolium]
YPPRWLGTNAVTDAPASAVGCRPINRIKPQATRYRRPGTAHQAPGRRGVSGRQLGRSFEQPKALFTSTQAGFSRLGAARSLAMVGRAGAAVSTLVGMVLKGVVGREKGMLCVRGGLPPPHFGEGGKREDIVVQHQRLGEQRAVAAHVEAKKAVAVLGAREPAVVAGHRAAQQARQRHIYRRGLLRRAPKVVAGTQVDYRYEGQMPAHEQVKQLFHARCAPGHRGALLPNGVLIEHFLHTYGFLGQGTLAFPADEVAGDKVLKGRIAK